MPVFSHSSPQVLSPTTLLDSFPGEMVRRSLCTISPSVFPMLTCPILVPAIRRDLRARDEVDSSHPWSDSFHDRIVRSWIRYPSWWILLGSRYRELSSHFYIEGKSRAHFPLLDHEQLVAFLVASDRTTGLFLHFSLSSTTPPNSIVVSFSTDLVEF